MSPDKARTFPWRDVMAFGLGRLRLSSADFWALTPRELTAAAEEHFGRTMAPLDRAAFNELIRRYPDKQDADRSPHD